jgi:diguanylate cyclase (GGDEF)-like protein/putative nucleotidyltransferase with HDIG domain
VLTILLACGVTSWAARTSSGNWGQFALFLIVTVLSSGFKVALPRVDGTMSLNFPFIFFAILQLSPLQVLLLAALSVLAQCRVKVTRAFTLVQIAFNMASTMLACALAYESYWLLTGHGLKLAPALALASIPYFVYSTGSVATIIGFSTKQSPLRVWRAEYPWYLPFYVVGAVLAAMAHALYTHFGWATSLLLIPMVYTVYRAYTAQITRFKERQQHLEETEALHLRTIEGLAMAIEAKDQNTHDHLFRVRNYVEEVGRAMGLPTLEMQALQTAAFLHDIGKLAVPEHIINKPGLLTPEEFEKMKIHPVVGADILERVRFPYPVVPIARSHHEWWNGDGYPDGLKGEQIPIGARVLTVADCLDALVSDRPYRKAMSSEDAFRLIESLAGSQFDPAVVHVLRGAYDRLEKPADGAAARTFSPLNTDVEVERGAAPVAGFEQPAEPVVTIKPNIVPAVARQNAQPSVPSLNLIAAASQEAHLLFEMSQSLGNSLRLNETLSVMASRLGRLVPFDTCALYIRKGDSLVAQYIDGGNMRSFSTEPILAGEGISGWVAQSGKPILNGNVAVEPNYASRSSLGGELRSALAIPLFDLQRQVFAVLTLYSSVADSFQRDHLRILQAMESKLSLSLRNAMDFRRAETDAETDYLTALPNARGLFLRVEEQLARFGGSDCSMTIVVCDLNEFKQVNDRYGHRSGDVLLGLVADAFRGLCRQGETVARMGGDEFVFVLPGVAEAEAAKLCAGIGRAVLSASMRCSGIDVKVSASIGAAFYPQDGTSAEELLAVADRRMYVDKQAYYQRMGDGLRPVAPLPAFYPRLQNSMEVMTL